MAHSMISAMAPQAPAEGFGDGTIGAPAAVLMKKSGKSVVTPVTAGFDSSRVSGHLVVRFESDGGRPILPMIHYDSPHFR